MSPRAIARNHHPASALLKTFSKNGLFGGLCAVSNTGLAVICSIATVRFLRNPKPLKQLGSTIGLFMVIRFPTIYQFEEIIAPRYGCDTSSVRSGGYVGAILGLSTLYLYNPARWIQLFGAAFLSGALVSGALGAGKSYLKIS
ncbi:MAG TPA: hypothetical protein VLG44_01615 [Chlamydiales bacterium]|nr:hypothetical protein [Chlamydiales bacterium]